MLESWPLPMNRPSPQPSPVGRERERRLTFGVRSDERAWPHDAEAPTIESSALRVGVVPSPIGWERVRVRVSFLGTWAVSSCRK